MKQNKERSAAARFSRGRIAVMGDLMLDVYLWGAVNRISPEAPVPVVEIRRRTCCPGGAANVMRNIATLGGKAEAIGVLGKDTAGEELLQLLQEQKIGLSGIVTTARRRTTEKCRIVAGAQQLLRADFETHQPVSPVARSKMVKTVLDMMARHEVDAVVFDDYAKGVLSASMLRRIIEEARKSGIVTLLDPKPKVGGVTPVSGLTVLKPNRSEAFALAGMRDPGPTENPSLDRPLHEAAEKIFSLWQPDNLLISLAAQGMILFSRGEEVTVIPTRAREVFDVSGAGDTVAAVCSLALATGASPLLAAELANRAAGIVVGKIGTAPILMDELMAALEDN